MWLKPLKDVMFSAASMWTCSSYERPRLQVVKVRTDSDQVREPEEMAKALAKALTPEELELLDKVALKLVSAPTIDGKAEPEPAPRKRGRPPKRP
jgi:hypothetical protein